MTAGSVVVYYTWVWLQWTADIRDNFCQSLKVHYDEFTVCIFMFFYHWVFSIVDVTMPTDTIT